MIRRSKLRERAGVGPDELASVRPIGRRPVRDQGPRPDLFHNNGRPIAVTYSRPTPPAGAPVGPGRLITAAARWLAAGLLAVCLAAAAEPRIEAQLSPALAEPGQAVELTLRVEGTDAGSPDLSVLDAGFRILDRRIERRITTLNGRRSEWVTLRLMLLPKATGDIQVPAIPFDGGFSEPLSLTVRAGEHADETPGRPPPADQAHPFVEPAPPPAPRATPTPAPAEDMPTVDTEVSPAQVRVDQQILLIARVRSSGSQRPGHLLDPDIDGARSLPLGEDRYRAPGTDADVVVYERRYALFPERAGTLRIPPLTFVSGAVPAAEVHSQPLNVDVRPAPEGFGVDRWLPAARVSLTEAGPDVYRARPGQTMQRLITLTADGIMAADLPALRVDAPYQLDVRTGPPRLGDRREPDGVIGTRAEPHYLTAVTEGLYRLPEVEVSWWNTATDRAETARLPARTLEVVALAEPHSGAQSRAAPGTGVPAEPAPEPARRAPPESRPAPAPVSSTGSEPVEMVNPWFWVSLGLAGALAALLAARRRRTSAAAESAPPAPAEPRQSDPLADALEAVRAAYGRADAVAARQALLDWAALQWPGDPPRNLARLALRCPDPLRHHIGELEKAFFSPDPIAWDREPVWQALSGLAGAPAEGSGSRGP